MLYLTRTDISNDSAYQDIIGSTYVTKNKMKVYGTWASAEPRVYHYLLVSLPGIGGREIKDLGCLPAGTILKITKIIKQTPSMTLDYDGILFVAEIVSRGEFFGLEVDIYNAFGTYTSSKMPDKYVLSNEHFSRIEEKQ